MMGKVATTPIRVALLMRKPYFGRHSIERLFERICAALPADIHATKFVSLFTGRGVLRRLIITLEAVFRQGDVTHVTGENYFVTLLLRRRTTILTIHDVLAPLRLKGVKRWLMLILWYRIPMSRAQVITVVSEATRRRLVELGVAGSHDIRVIHNCSFADFSATPKMFDHNCPVVLLLGTGWYKNVERVVEALSSVRCRVRLIGQLTPSQRLAIGRASLSLTAISGLSDEQLATEYRNCDVVVFASIEEGFGLPILEAQAIGRVVVTSNVSSMPEVAGDAAEFVDPFSVDSIRQGVQRVITDEGRRNALIERGFANVLRFDPNRVAEQYALVYRELAGVARWDADDPESSSILACRSSNA